MVKQFLIHQMKSQLHPNMLSFIKDAGASAQNLGYRAFLAGGVVRDLILDRPVIDVDIVIQGNAPKLARKFAEKIGTTITSESQFNTAKLSVFSTTVDFASARKETYSNPGELPKVEMADLSEDLHRRDFSINAMAIALNSDEFGKLIDPLDGQNDILNKHIRILHPASFQDDPTRILRAIRYEQRLGFKLEPITKESIIAHSKYLHCISPDRLRNEFQKIFEEIEPGVILARATELGILNSILPGWAWPQVTCQKIKLSNGFKKESKFKLLISLLTAFLTPEERETLIGKLNMPSSWQKVVRSTNEFEEQKLNLEKTNLPPSEIYIILNGFDISVLEVWSAILENPKIRERIRFYIDVLCHKKPRLTGNDLIRLGVTPGPEVGAILRKLHQCVLDEPRGEPPIEEDLVRDFLNGDTKHW